MQVLSVDDLRLFAEPWHIQNPISLVLVITHVRYHLISFEL